MSGLKNKVFLFFLCFIGTAGIALAQEEFELDSALAEISGLEQLNDTILVAINDGGNDPVLYLIGLNGQLYKKVNISNAKNKDWETLARDENYLYIGDLGNNGNRRKDLSVYRVKIADILSGLEVVAEKSVLTYIDQLSFPPSEDSLYFDVEGMVVMNDSIWIFTKNRAASGNLASFVYVLPIEPGNYVLEKRTEINTGDCGWLSCGVTAADIDGDHVYLLTYTKMMIFTIENGTFVLQGTFEFESAAQRESLLVLKTGDLLITDERNAFLGEQKMYRIKKEQLEK